MECYRHFKIKVQAADVLCLSHLSGEISTELWVESVEIDPEGTDLRTLVYYVVASII